MTKTIITKQGLKELNKKAETLEKRIKEMLVEKAVAYELSGDGWHDNPGWIQIGQQEERLNKDLMILREHLKNAKVVEEANGPSEFVIIGSVVRFVQKIGTKSRQLEFKIVGSLETDINENRIAYDTPLGAAMMGHKKGESFAFNAPIGPMHLEILEIK